LDPESVQIGSKFGPPGSKLVLGMGLGTWSCCSC